MAENDKRAKAKVKRPPGWYGAAQKASRREAFLAKKEAAAKRRAEEHTQRASRRAERERRREERRRQINLERRAGAKRIAESEARRRDNARDMGRRQREEAEREAALADIEAGRDTPRARALQSRLTETQGRAKVAGDPLGLSPESRRLAKKRNKGQPAPKPDPQADLLRKAGHYHALKEERGVRQVRVGFDGDPSGLEESRGRIKRTSPDPLLSMYHAESITAIQLQAAELLRADYEVMSRGGVKPQGWDVRVDGGGLGTSIPAGIIDAANRVVLLFEAVGEFGENLLLEVVVLRTPLVRLKEKLGMDRMELKGRLAACLDSCAIHYGLAQGGRRRRRKPDPAAVDAWKESRRLPVSLRPLDSVPAEISECIAVRLTEARRPFPMVVRRDDDGGWEDDAGPIPQSVLGQLFYLDLAGAAVTG